MIANLKWCLVCTFGESRFERLEIHKRLLQYLRVNQELKRGDYIGVLNVLVRIIELKHSIPQTDVRQLEWHERIRVDDICYLPRFLGREFIGPMAVAVGETVDEMFYRTQRTGPLQVFRSTAKPNESES
jgi:hypothetical protein